MEQMGEICLEHEPVNVFLAPDSYRRAQMWEVRRQVSSVSKNRLPSIFLKTSWFPSAASPSSSANLPELAAAFGMKIFAFGHAGDGNIHLNITAGSRDDLPRIEEGIKAVLKLVLSMGGTISGEHGIGFAKKHLLPLELSPESIRLQQEIKRVFDPNLILNPGKIF